MATGIRNPLKGHRTAHPPKTNGQTTPKATVVSPPRERSGPGFGGQWLYLAMVSVLAVVVSVLAIHGSVPKIGYVDTTLLLQRYEQAEEARATFQSEAAEWQANVQTLQQELAALAEGLADGGLRAPGAIEERQEQIEEKEAELARYSRAVAERAAQREKELMEPIFVEINAQMRAFGEREGYDLVLGTVAGGNILYANDATDLTEEVLAHLHSR